MNKLMDQCLSPTGRTTRPALCDFHQFLVSPEMGGAGLIALDIANELQERGFEPRVWIPGAGPSRDEAMRRRLPVGMYNAEAAIGKGRWRAGLENIRLARKLRRQRPGIVHVHSPQMFGALRRALKYSKLKRIAHVHLDDDSEGLRWAFREPPEAIVTCARFLIDIVRKAIPPERQDQVRIVAVSNAVDLSRYAPGNRAEAKQALGALPDVPLLLMMANLAPHKGQETAIRAVSILKSRGIGVQCWLAGCERDRGLGYERRLRQLAADAGVHNEVRFLGFRTDGPEMMRAADFLLLPSAREGLPLSILEAQATRVPVLAAPVAGVPEVITHEQTGLLIGHDDAAGYAHWIGRLLSTPALCEHLAEQGYQRVHRQNSWKAYIEQVWSIYQELLTPVVI